MKTFFISSSSHEAQRTVVQALAKQIYHKFGWRNYFDWTKGFAAENAYPDHELIYRAKMDREGAANADVFIFLDTEVRSLGANREYGVRWGLGKTIYRVSRESRHLFDLLDNVVTVSCTDVLMAVLEEREWQ